MTRTFLMTSLALAGLFGTPALAAADDPACGRWVPCAESDALTPSDVRSYVYGTRTEIEPWAPETEKDASSTPEARAKAPASGAGGAAVDVKTAEEIAAGRATGAPAREADVATIDEDFTSVDEMSAAEEAAARAYLAKVDAERNGTVADMTGLSSTSDRTSDLFPGRSN